MAARPKKSFPKKPQRRAAKGTPSRKKRSKPEMVIKTEFSPHLFWMYHYLRRAKLKMPNLVLPNKIRSFKPTRSKIMRVLGNAYFGNRTVVVATHTQVTYMNRKGQLKVRKIVRLPKSRILDTLAHEIAHFQYEEHGYEHEEFTRSIFKTFGLKERCPYCKGTGKIQLEGKP